MLNQVKFVPTSEQSKPFAAAAETCAFNRIGYVEDEYFQYGTARIYEEDALHAVSPIFEGAPYCTRVLIRRPKDVEKFSGNVVIEILNSSANIDIDRMWVNSWPFFTRNGDIYVGISSKGHVVDSLKKFDPERYRDIDWSNPMPDRIAPDEVKNDRMRFLPQFESGLFWDMMVDLAKLLRSSREDNPLRQYGKRCLYLTGWSQSTGYINRFIRSFSYLPENRADGPLFDGYLIAGGSDSLAPINAYTPRTGMRGGYPSPSLMGAKEPFIALNTESENRFAFWYGDFDEPEFKFRTWQIAGSSHDTKYNLLDYYGEDGLAVLDRLGIKNAYYGVDGDPLDAPYEVVFNAAFWALYRWVRDGIPAPHAPKIETYIGSCPSGDPFGSYVGNLTDAFGNCRGGIQTPAIRYPTGKYTSYSVGADGRVYGMFGKVNPFSPEKLASLYGNLENYRSLIESDCDRLIAEGFMLKDDKVDFVKRVVNDAKKRGLR